MSDALWSVVPPIAAIVLAIVTRRVLLSLSLGLLAGSLILHRGALPSAIGGTLRILRDSLANYDAKKGDWDVDHIKILLFTLIMGAMVGTVYRTGGMAAVANGVASFAKTRRRGQLATWLLGLIVFIDDYANSLLLGNTMRPLTDRLKISREKLAYLVDSTAAPVSGMALVSTWVAGEMSYIQTGLDNVAKMRDVGFTEGVTVDAFELFVLSIPTRFYVIWALLFVPIVAWLQRDFGPMLQAERRALRGQVAPDGRPLGARQASSAGDSEPIHEPVHDGGHWSWAIVPILATVGVTALWLVGSGLKNTGATVDALRSLDGWVGTIGDASTSDALMIGSLTGWICGLVLGRTVGWGALLRGSVTGAKHVIPACAILWLAWGMGILTDQLGTAQHLADGVQQVVSAWALPTVVFVLASLVAFSTGTSWGTMGILMPIVVPTAVGVIASSTATAAISPTDPLFVATIAGVLAGAIWGDHCSPISDTTVLSSAASHCDHIAHVRTQMPYALLVGGVSIVFGTLVVGWGGPVWLTHVLGLTSLIAIMRLIGVEPTADESNG